MEPILTLQNISAYDKDGRALVPPTSLTVLSGERVRVVGSRPRFEALARIAGGLTEPDGGEITLLGQPLRDWRPLDRAARIGHMPSDPGFWEGMTVLDNTALPLIASGVSRYERREAAMAVLESLGLGYAAHAYPKSLGLCEQRLAALARALARGPELLILAEPVSMLDEKETRRFTTALSERWEADRFAVVYSGREILPTDRTIRLQEGE